MSASDFMRGTSIGTLVLIFDGSPPYPPPWPIKVYEIDEEEMVGVIYPDCRQVQSRKWWAKRLADAPPVEEQVQIPDRPRRTLVRSGKPALTGEEARRFMAEGRGEKVEAEAPVRRKLVRPADVEPAPIRKRLVRPPEPSITVEIEAEKPRIRSRRT